MKKVILLATVGFGMSGCMGQNPYPAGNITTTAPQLHQVTPAYVLDTPQTVWFTESVAGSFTIPTTVPTGYSVVTVAGLPPGATFDPATSKFSWTPSASAGHDPAHPDVFQVEYHVRFSLSSSNDPLTVVTHDVQLMVRSVAMPISIVVSTKKMEIQEGQPLTVTFQVSSVDFPKGPFALQMDKLPAGATLTQSDQDPSQFVFGFTPPYNFTTRDDDTDGSGFSKTVHLTVSATGPRAQKATAAVDLVVHDVRLPPVVSVSDNLVFSYAAEFSVSAEDLNGESKPSITFDEPAFGKVAIQDAARKRVLSRDRNSQNPVQLSVVDWTGIPSTEFNKPQKLTLHICTQGSDPANEPAVDSSNCRVQVVNMTFQGQLHNAPSFDRSQWDAGEVKFVRLGTNLQIAVPVKDPDSEDAPTVDIQPATMKAEVSYADGAVTVNPTTAGSKVFQLVTKSAFGIETRESFSIRVLPKTWGSMIVLGESPKDAEVKATLGIVTDSQLVNPALDTIDSEMLVLRKVAFVTTSAINAGLSTGDFGSLLGKLSGTLSQVIVSTPLISKLPRPSLPDDLVLAGRFNDLTLAGKPTLNAMSLVPTANSVFMASQKPVKLNQSLTAESSNPMTFGVGTNGSCSVLMTLKKDAIELPVVVECTTATSRGAGKILYSGFEWGDLAFDSAESGLGQTWLQSWLSGRHQ